MPEELTTPEPAVTPGATTTQPAPPLAAAPLTASPRTSDRPFWRRPLVLALLVLVAGAALGAAGFAAEQHYFVWKPDVTAAAGGWRVTGGDGARPTAPALSGDHLAWGQGLFTCVMDLSSGDTHVIGFASSRMSIWPPSISSRFVSWMESPRSGRGASLVWLYDISRGRRISYLAHGAAATSAVGDRMLAWFEAGQPGKVVGVYLASGQRTTLAEGSDLDYPVLASGPLVGWLAKLGGVLSATLKNVDSQAAVSVPLTTGGSGVTVGDIQLAGGHLVWTQQAGSSTRIMDYDAASGTTTIVAEGDVQRPATDGRIVVWATASATGSGTTIMGRPSDGGRPFIVTRLATWPDALAVGGGRLAWTSEDDSGPYLQTVSLPR